MYQNDEEISGIIPNTVQAISELLEISEVRAYLCQKLGPQQSKRQSVQLCLLSNSLYTLSL